MKKLKLGIVIKTTNNGVSEIFSANKEENWARHATDVRAYIKELDQFDGTDKHVLLTRFFGADGYMIAVIKASPKGSGREYDNTAAWIHFPAKINITAEETHDIIQVVIEELSAEKSIGFPRLTKAFNKEYGSKEVLFTAVEFITSNRDGKIGYRRYGTGCDYTRREFLGDSIAQSVYGNYKGIFFIDSQSDITVDGEEIQDGIKKIRPLPAPDPKECKGYTPYLEFKGSNPIPFSKPIEIPEDRPVRIVLKKEGYKEITKKLSADKPRPEIEPGDILRIIRRDWFRVVDADDNLDDLTLKVHIFIDGKPFFNGSGILYVEETSPSSLHKVTVTCDGYENYESTLEIKEVKERIQIPLKVKEYEETYIFPKKEGNGLKADAKVVITTKKSPPKKPFKGYDVDVEGNKKKLRHNNDMWLKAKCFGLGIVCTVLLIILYQGYVAIDDYFDNHVVKVQFGWPPITTVEKQHKKWYNSQEDTGTGEQQTTGTDTTNNNVDTCRQDGRSPDDSSMYKSTKAIANLNGNDEWNKDSLGSTGQGQPNVDNQDQSVRQDPSQGTNPASSTTEESEPRGGVK